MQILENMAVKNWLHGDVKVGDHVIQKSKGCQKILGKFAKFCGVSLNRLEVTHL